jgi:UPF0755 protein
MIPAAQDPTQEPDAGSVPTVSGQDRIGATPSVADSEAETIIVDLARRPPETATSVVAPLPDAPTVVAVPSSAPPVSISAPEIASHRQEVGAIAPVVRPVAPAFGAGTPSVVPPPSPIGPTAAVPPPPPRPVIPPPLPLGAMPRLGQSRSQAVRPPLSPQQYPMPSTIAPTEQVRKRSRFRSKAARSSVVVVFDGMMSLATIVALILWLAAFAGLHEFETPGPLKASTVVIIPPKKSRDEIGDLLENAGVVSNGTVFVYGSAIAQASDWKAGEYEFHAGETMHEVADELVQNKVVQHKITFPEGWTSEQIVQRLVDDPILTGKVVAIPEEGSLLPDTYTYPRGETRQQVLDRMSKNMTRRLTDIWAHRNADLLKALKVPKDLVILASIIEKETSKPDERARIAAVFVNRLNRNMRLETDPTILYGLYGGKAWTEPRTITRADLVAPNPYNTYKINGLPPGPIANPGRASLEAAANPATTNELFFVADGTGGHAFADTLDEHNKNVAKWREIERQRKLIDPNAQSPTVTGTGTGTLTAPIPLVTPSTTVVKPVQQRRSKPVVPTDPASNAN